jgi:dipeptidase E
MKLILASAGFNAPEVVAKCVEMVGKPAGEINIAVINEAMSVEFGDHRWFLDDMDSIKNNFGGNIEFVNLLALPLEKIVERLNIADVIFVAGGNADHLMTVFDKVKLTPELPKLLGKKVYVGSSAGSCVLGHRPSYKTFSEVYKEDQYTDKYLEIVYFVVLPHLHSAHFDTRDDQWVLDDSTQKAVPVYAISDNVAVVVDGDKIEVVGRDWIKAVGGRVVDKNEA